MHVRGRYARMSTLAGLRDRYVRSVYAAGVRVWVRGRYARTWPTWAHGHDGRSTRPFDVQVQPGDVRA